MSNDKAQMPAVERLIAAFGKLPGVGAKTAERLAHHILKCEPEEALALAEAIRAAKEQIRHCAQCYNLTESESSLCSICRDPRRDPTVLCVVEQARDLMALERAGTFSGMYHVLLGRLAPLQGVFEDHLTVAALETRVAAGGIQEIILATNPNLEGDGTARLVADRLATTGVSLTRLARGLASGGVLEFANKEMLADALSGRQRF